MVQLSNKKERNNATIENLTTTAQGTANSVFGTNADSILCKKLSPYTKDFNSIQTASNAATILDTSSIEEVTKYHHQLLGSPPILSILRPLRNHPDKLLTFPGMNRRLITKHLPPSTATTKGHMTRARKGLRSTKEDDNGIDARATEEDMVPQEQMCSAEDDDMFCYSITTNNDGNVIYSDSAGRFPVELYAGMNYFLICYVYKCNHIVIRTMKSRRDVDKLHVLDNECSRAVKNYITTEQTEIQPVEPHNHRVNAAEPAVKSTKYHMLVNFATLDPNCPIQLW